MDKIDAFKHYKAKSTRQSWSAINEDGEVVCTFWSHIMRYETLSYSDVEKVNQVMASRGADYLMKKQGMKQRIKHLTYAKEHCDGLVYVVMVRAKDTAPDDLEAIDHWYRDDWRMRIKEVNPTTGAITAQLIVLEKPQAA